MTNKPNQLKSTIYLHKPTQTRYRLLRTEGDECVMEPVSGREIRAKKANLENAEAWSKLP